MRDFHDFSCADALPEASRTMDLQLLLEDSKTDGQHVMDTQDSCLDRKDRAADFSDDRFQARGTSRRGFIGKLAVMSIGFVVAGSSLGSRSMSGKSAMFFRRIH